jgi:hypothetical protein
MVSALYVLVKGGTEKEAFNHDTPEKAGLRKLDRVETAIAGPL